MVTLKYKKEGKELDMELFSRRYFCFICFAFMLTAFSLTFCENSIIKIIVAGVAALLLACAAVFFISTKKHKFQALFAVFLCIAVSVSAFSSYFFVSRVKEDAEALVGRNTVLIKIVSKSYDDRYNARIMRVGDNEVDVKANLYWDDDTELEYGDRLIFNANIRTASDPHDISKLLAVYKVENSEVYINKVESGNYFSYDGIMALCHRLQNLFSAHVDKVFGDYGALAKGLLVNDTSDIDAKTETDFKRSGTSHILAVSGTHIALLMGAVELILRKIEVKKGIRMVVITVLSLFFLALTSFEASAVRSVLMLFAVYLCYIFYEENDSITSLFASVTLIILFSPFSVYDLGMWMSFLATLGILAVYPYFDEKMPYPKQENLFVRYTLRLFVGIAKAFMLTVIANFFLLPIMWYFFGVASISTLPCNIILGPIVAVLMPLCAFTTVIGFIPYISIPFVFLTNKLFDVMMLIVRYFSEMRFGVVSLRYEFAGVLITLFSAVLAVMLVIKFKHKLVIFIPMLAFVVAFVSCVAVFNKNARPYVQCVKDEGSEVVFVNSEAECSVIDLGVNNRYTGSDVLRLMSIYATEIEKYFIVSVDEKDATTIEYVCKNTIIRKIYLPKTINKTEEIHYYDILKCAEKYNIAVELYDDECNVEICNGVLFNYSDSDGATVLSDKVRLQKSGDSITCLYGERYYDLGYSDGVSQKIPLN